MQEWSVNSFEAEPYLVAQGASAECLNESGGEVEDSPNLWSLWSLDALRTAEQVDRETSILENLEMGKPSGGLQFRTITKTAYLCTFKRCNKQFTRIYDLRRHHEGVHERKASFTCSWIDCRRHVEAFTRKDKRDEHERKIHGNTSNNKRGGRARFQNLGLDHGSQAMDVQAAALSFPVSSSWIGTEF
ncbi:hypothetical protein B0J11DRAFT_264187 [Dendryphion nanum]|uniref:C2H2-type domain-containing protein n=1 Tax=Dendryphion nanum TaxID=256645 RepID=A0A9P9IR61_9PLEO|nr:hypothetical protein B0J11DRAFT_264187 [Dendryphion nanum]